MIKSYILLVICACLILLFTGCAKQDIKQVVKPFDNIPVDLAKSVNLSDFTITSEMKESGRLKRVTEKQDMEILASYISTINCTESTRKIKDADFSIQLSDGIGNFIYTIGVSKNQIYMYKGINSTKFVYDYIDTNVIKELQRIYKTMNYKEELMMKK